MNAAHAKPYARPEQELAALGLRYLLALAPQPSAITSANDTTASTDPALLNKQISTISAGASKHDTRLLQLQALFEFSDAALLTAALAFRVETDPFLAHQIARFQEPVGNAHLLVGFLGSAFGLDDAGTLELAQGPAVTCGLLRLGDEKSPLCERSLAMPTELLSALDDRQHKVPFASSVDIPEVLFSSGQKQAVGQHAEWLEQAPGQILHILSADQDEALAAAGRIAKQIGRNLVRVESDCAIPPAWISLANALPLYETDLGIGEQWRLPKDACRISPHIVLSNLDGRLDSPRPRQEWHGRALNVDEREEVWQEWDVSKQQAQSLARRYRQGAGAIARAARAIRTNQETGTRPADIGATESLAHTHPELDRLAHRCPFREIPDDALVAPENLIAALHQVEQRILFREQLADSLGPALSARYRPGMRALFTGESGTGKTLAAHWLAERLGLPLYRVDMAALSSKWIGETEKNLSQLLAAAETSDAILFFDEADALFGSRTDIGDSNDRHANAQTNFLLQRIEDFEGIALLTTNSRDRFDSAFVRRLDAILEFPLPDAAARRALWQAHLGTAHSLASDDIDLLARELDFPGGHIRNVVLSAAALAIADRRTIAGRDIDFALAEECRKLGRTPPGILLNSG